MPGKAAYLALENDPDLEFLFYLAERLHRSVAEVVTLEYAEFVLWTRYYARKAQARQMAEQMASQ